MSNSITFSQKNKYNKQFNREKKIANYVDRRFIHDLTIFVEHNETCDNFALYNKTRQSYVIYTYCTEQL